MVLRRGVISVNNSCLAIRFSLLRSTARWVHWVYLNSALSGARNRRWMVHTQAFTYLLSSARTTCTVVIVRPTPPWFLQFSSDLRIPNHSMSIPRAEPLTLIIDTWRTLWSLGESAIRDTVMASYEQRESLCKSTSNRIKSFCKIENLLAGIIEPFFSNAELSAFIKFNIGRKNRFD